MPHFENYHIINDNKNKTNRRIIILASITKEIENKLDELEDGIFTLTCGEKIFNLTHRNIYCYGKVDLNDEEICETINNFDFLDYLNGVGAHIYTDYDYNLHACLSPRKNALWAETWDPIDLVKFAHGGLGKPKRIILFKYNPDDKTLQKKR